MKPIAVSAVVLLSGAMACESSVPPPNDQWGAAQADVGRAQAGGAPQSPEAKLHLQLAQEDLQKAKGLSGVDNRRATTLTELARVEAQLALSLAKSSEAEENVSSVAADVQKATQSK